MEKASNIYYKLLKCSESVKYAYFLLATFFFIVYTVPSLNLILPMYSYLLLQLSFLEFFSAWKWTPFIVYFLEQPPVLYLRWGASLKIISSSFPFSQILSVALRPSHSPAVFRNIFQFWIFSPFVGRKNIFDFITH